MKKVLLLIFFVGMVISCTKTKKEASVSFDFTTTFEKSNGTETATYNGVINFYTHLAQTFPEISIKEIGETDSGKPLHMVILNSDKEFDFNKIDTSKKSIVLINNGIHPGESDGIDASMMLLRDIVKNEDLLKSLDNIILVVIPIYNVGGALNRNRTTRANQNGPKEYGFRGNARNFDLNRDFIKNDTKNAQTFSKIFHVVNPDVFVDTHVSNGADYQYAITHLFTQHNKLGNDLGVFIEHKMRPEIEKKLLQKNISITPYVNVWGTTPKSGFSQFLDTPRYSTGYTSLFNTLGLMIETHMLKPYKQRVNQTYSLLEIILKFTANNSSEIKKLRKNAISKILAKKKYPIAFTLDENTFSNLNFKGFEGTYIASKVTSGKRLFYDRTKPYTKTIKYYNTFKPSVEITIPKAYIIKRGWWKVINRLKNNNIRFTVFKNDTTFTVSEQRINTFETSKMPFEGHYLHYNTTTTSKKVAVTFSEGDIYISVNQPGARYLMETLEAEAPDSFFNWNFFDTVLQQKEGYSAYVFEDIAEHFLSENSSVKKLFLSKIKNDTQFANNPSAQLNFIYKNSPYYEKAHLKLPIYKVF